MNAFFAEDRLLLPQVTLCAVTSVNVEATVRALEACLAQVVFADCKLLTDAPVRPRNPAITVVPIERLNSSVAYSEFLLTKLVDHVDTSHCLVAQWDGHVLDARCWNPQFLNYDYIGASWPQFGDGHDVGNGGFSLRSRRLMEACRAPGFQQLHPEDLAIGRINREWLEGRGMQFAPRALGDLFAAERGGDLACAFGYHGAWNMPHALGVQAFWSVYRTLDDRGTIWADFGAIVKSVSRGPGGSRRAARLMADRLLHTLRKVRKRRN